MRKVLPFLFLSAALFAAPARAAEKPSLLHGGSATPNFFGATGLLEIPSASVVGDRGIAGDAYFTGDFQSYGLLVGPFDRLEVGGTYLREDRGHGHDDDFLFDVKYQVVKENTVIPGVAVGLIDAFAQFRDEPSWYAVASKGFPKFLPVLGGLRLHAGFGGGIYNERPFAGLELGLGTPLDLIPFTHPKFSFIAEYVDEDVNVGLRGRWRGLAGTVALFNGDTIGGGISYTTGLRLW